jgi:hypothetical protein
MPDFSNPETIKAIGDLGIAFSVVLLVVFFELCTWKNREQAQRNEKEVLIKALQDVATALALSVESSKQTRELLMAYLGRSEKNGTNKN